MHPSDICYRVAWIAGGVSRGKGLNALGWRLSHAEQRNKFCVCE